jgi:hypothetical protein
MKKLFLLLVLVSSFSFSQEDKGSREMFKVYKKFPIESVEIKDMVIKYLDELKLKTKDTELITEIDNYKTKISSIALPEFKKIDFDSIPKDKLKNFRTSYDKFKKSGFISHKKNKDIFKIYLNINKEASHVRIKSRYFGSNWLFVKKIIFLIDGEKMELEFLNPDTEVLSGSGVNVEEITDQAVLKDSQKLLDAIYKSKQDIEIRFEGTKGVRDYVIKQKDLTPIRETIDLYNSF